MKKLLIVLSIVFLMSGCDMGNDTLTCTSTSSANGMTTDTKYEIKYSGDDVKFVTITYDYNQNNDTITGTDNTNNNNNTDGVNADTDGTTKDNDITNNDGRVNSNEVVDGVVGDTVDGVVDGVTDTILDLAGVRSTFENQMSSYDNIKGFSYDVDVDNDNEYKVVYKIDFDKISDSDLTRFNVDRDFSTIRSNYEDLGYTCK